MDRLFESMRPLIRAVVRYAGWVLTTAILFSAVSFYFAKDLRIDTDLANLIPQDYPSVQALERLRATVGGERTLEVAITSPSFQDNQRFAEDFIPEALSLERGEGESTYLTRVEYEREVDFIRDNALYFASNEELRQVEEYLAEQEREAKLEANPFYFDLDEEEDETEADSSAQELEAVYERLVGTRYMASDDSTTLVLRFYTSQSSTNIAFIDSLYTDVQALVDRMGPDTYNAGMDITLAGSLYRQFVEIRTIQRDVLGSFGVGVATVLLVVVLYFLYKSYQARTGGVFSRRVFFQELARAPVMALVIGLPLIMSLAWTGGVAYLAFGTLNLMTSTLGLVLFGLGIDFGIHFYGRYAEERADGARITEAAETTFASTGQAIAVGALTTASALFVLTVADFKGFSEFGLIAGTGILFALIAMTLVMPALMAVLERSHLLDLRASAMSAPIVEPSSRPYPAARAIVMGSFALVIASLILLPRASFEYDFGELEPEYTEYEERDDVVDRALGGSGGRRNPAYIVVDDRSEVPEVVAAVRKKMRADSTSPTIEGVESLQERFPLRDTAQQNKLERIAQIREAVNSDFVEENEQTGRLRRAAQTQEPIPIEQVPESLRKQFTTKSGEIGTFVLIYPSVGLSDGRNSIAFAEDVGSITTADGETYYAGSTSLVAADMLKLMQEEAPWMIAATLVIVALLMGLNFRSVRWAGLALIPLIVGILWMLLAMEVFGIELNFYNIIVLPAILGIGNDAGVHLVHRYREEGFGSIGQVLRSTGEHVTAGSVTTMIGFGGLLLSFHPGLRSIGVLAVVGIGTTLLSALIFLPALLQWLEDRQATPTDDGEPEAPSEKPARTTSAEELEVS